MPDPDAPPAVAAFWADFLSRTGRPDDTPLYDNEPDANMLASLVLDGWKRATASLRWEYDGESGRPPEPGDLSIVTLWDGTPVCVIETTAVDVVSFDDVDEDLAAAEGEGDGSPHHWRAAHERYFERVCERIGREPSPRMDVVCERFGRAWSHLSARVPGCAASPRTHRREAIPHDHPARLDH